MASPDIQINNREQLLYTLSEASEIEHNLMCCYLYAAWSLKTEPDDDVEEPIRNELQRWQRSILRVAVDEMSHLALVANLMNAIGGSAHLHRPNFPIASGYHPAGLQVRLAPFNRSTLQHFIHLERPEGSIEPDGEDFPPPLDYRRGLNGLQLMPAAQDFATVGHLYHALEAGLRGLCSELGEKVLFCGDPKLQVGPDLVSLPGLITVTDLASACKAIETIVEQGEGSRVDSADSHFQRFIAIRTAYEALLKDKPGFSPAYPAAHNPVMRKPPDPRGRVWIQFDEPRAVLDLANAVYNHMLRCLAQGFGDSDQSRKRVFLDGAIDLMFALDPLARELARMKANSEDTCNAGLSFATLRAYPSIDPNVAQLTLAERVGQLKLGTAALPNTSRVKAALAALEAIHGKLIAPDREKPPQASATTEPSSTAGPEIADGNALSLTFDTKRCIHARFCVTGAPKTFLANVKGDWLFPDETEVSRLVEIAHACPSGAITYKRKDGAANELAPPVNLLNIREAGPYAVKAELLIGGQRSGFRATLCRCGASKNKPFCDGSHHEAGFAASGEPETVSLDPLSVRDGALHIDPQKDGPLKVSGNLEICSGTGRVVKRVTQARLCRCGQSKTKPFCDGSHRAAAFTADGD